MQNNPGGNECALEGKGLGFESEQDLFFFFKRLKFWFKKMSAYYLSAYVLSA